MPIAAIECGVELGDDVGERAVDGVPDLVGVVLDPAGTREVLGELAVRRRARPAVGVDGHGADAGGAGIDGEHDGHRQ